MSGDRPVVIFDGECGFCTWCVEFARRRVHAPVDYCPYQVADFASLAATRDQAREAVLFVHGHTVSSGASAVAAILRAGRRPWPMFGAALDSTLVRPVAARAYRFVARHRGRLPGVRPALSARPPSTEAES